MSPAIRPFKAAVLQYTARGTQQDTLPIVEALIGAAASAGADIVCLPECANFLAANKTALKEQVEDEANSPTLDLLSALAKKHRIIVSAGSLMMANTASAETDTRVANRSFLINEHGAIIARYDKIHMLSLIHISEPTRPY